MQLTDYPNVAQVLATRPDLAVKLAADPLAGMLLERFLASNPGPAGTTTGGEDGVIGAIEDAVGITANWVPILTFTAALRAAGVRFDWSTVITWITTNLPTILALITAIIPLFGGTKPAPIDPPTIPIVT